MTEIPKAYEPQSVEDKWYDFWLKQGCFTADPARVSDQRPAYSIVIPPPNVTGMLHMGHVLNNTIQDILSRKARMDGKEVLWLPGTDHAGIATEGMVSKQIWKEEKKSKRDIGREEFIKRVWQWKEKHGGIIIEQLKKLGCSCDWTRERFTMDPEYSRCVQKVFVELYKKGLIYRGNRMVNWCPASRTALSDEEVIMKEQNGFLYYFKVPVVDEKGPVLGAGNEPVFLTIATTRPETIPGDTAVAVNPKDPRYAHLIGKHVIRPLPISESDSNPRVIPIIGDEHVDFEFGTGVLKVTPAHDKADFEIGQRHKLRVVLVMKDDGTMSDETWPDFEGLDRFEARKKAVQLLEERGALVKQEPYVNKVGYSERTDVPIEPWLSMQWFLKYPSVSESKSCVADGHLQFHPDRWAKVYDHWLTNIQDWCISRQLWWGHRIPVWRRKYSLGHEDVPQQIEKAIAKPREMIGLSGKAGEWSSCEKWTLLNMVSPTIEVYASTYFDREAEWLESHGFTQDPDVLDTWFSSWLWPFATMGWPEQTDTLKKFYPTTDLVTGPDIIFFWVARMIMAGYEYMGELPFKNVYFTGIIRDKQGRKMSKTLGNSPDPLELIAKYGADALRFGTMRSAPLGQDVLFDEKDVELGRNFCNKLWNACRFRQLVGQASRLSPSETERTSKSETGATPVLRNEVEGEINPALLTSDDKWILLRLDQAIYEVSEALANYKFNEATAALYRFFWSEYCDWYVEASKAVFFSTDDKRKANTLAVIDFVLSHTLRLFHPFLPFITEDLWHGMGFSKDLPANQGGKTIMFAVWPKPFTGEEKTYFGLDDAADKIATAKYELVSLGRNLRHELKLDPAKKLKFVLKPAGELPPIEIEVLRLLLNAESIEVNARYVPAKGTPMAANTLGELYLPLEGLIDAAAEKTRLTKDLAKIDAEIEKVQAKLGNPNFVQKVPPTVLEEHRQRLTDWQAKRQQVQAMLRNLG